MTWKADLIPLPAVWTVQCTLIGKLSYLAGNLLPALGTEKP